MFARDYGTLASQDILPFWGLKEGDILLAFDRLTVKAIHQAAVIAVNMVAAACLDGESGLTSDVVYGNENDEDENSSGDADGEDNAGDKDDDSEAESFVSVGSRFRGGYDRKELKKTQNRDD